MAKSLSVSAEGWPGYEIKLTDSFRGLSECLRGLGYHPGQKLCIVTDSNVGPLYAAEVKQSLEEYFGTVIVHSFPAGEQNKNLETVNHVYETLIRNHFDRGDVLAALGGGVVGDLTGFVAATYLRGVDFIQIPTTLLSQVDSSIGGKTGVDFLQYKNMVGAFFQPRLVYMNLNVLGTLPKKQIVSGMGEIIKHGLIRDAAFYSWLNQNREKILALDFPVLEEMVHRSCLIKRDVVERDPKEKGERALLNFGHTIGHAIEKLSGFSLYHGECVALGIVAASHLSFLLGKLTREEQDGIERCLASFGFSVRARGFSPEEILAASKSDKKMSGGKVKFILLSGIGNAYIDRNLTDGQLLDGIRYVCGEDAA